MLAPRATPVPAARPTSSGFRSRSITPQLAGTSVTLLLEQNGSKRVVPCQLGVDVTFTPWGITAGEIEAPVVFAGFGEVDADKGIDDYDGIEVKGRFVLIFAGSRPEQSTARRPTSRNAPRPLAGAGEASDRPARKRRSSEAPSE